MRRRHHRCRCRRCHHRRRCHRRRSTSLRCCGPPQRLCNYSAPIGRRNHPHIERRVCVWQRLREKAWMDSGNGRKVICDFCAHWNFALFSSSMYFVLFFILFRAGHRRSLENAEAIIATARISLPFASPLWKMRTFFFHFVSFKAKIKRFD